MILFLAPIGILVGIFMLYIPNVIVQYQAYKIIGISTFITVVVWFMQIAYMAKHN